MMTLVPRDLGTEQGTSGPFRPHAQELSRSGRGGRNSGQDPTMPSVKTRGRALFFFGRRHDTSKPSYQTAASDIPGRCF